MVAQQRQERIIRQQHQQPFPFDTTKEIDPIMSPATAAVEKLIPLPERECKRMRYDDDDDDEDDGFDEGNTFDMSALARVSIPIKESLAFPLIEWSIGDNESSSTSSSTSSDDVTMEESMSRAHSFLDNFLLTTSNSRLHRMSPSPSSSFSSLVSKRRIKHHINHGRLVRSIALDSRLALLDPSPCLIGRCCSSTSVPANENGFNSVASSVSFSTTCNNNNGIPMSLFQDFSVLLLCPQQNIGSNKGPPSSEKMMSK